MALRDVIDAAQSFPMEVAEDRRPRPELRRSRWSDVFMSLYRAGYGLRSRRVMQNILRLTLNLEGGEFFSHTARRLMQKWHGLDIGAYSYGCFDDSRFAGGVRVGRYVSIARSVRSYRRNHPTHSLSTHPFFYNSRFARSQPNDTSLNTLLIEHDAWIGAHALILPGCRRIGIGAIVGAGSVVTRDVEPYTVVAGNPARPIRKRFDSSKVERILRSSWWERSYQNVERHIDELENGIFPDLTRRANPNDITGH